MHHTGKLIVDRNKDVFYGRIYQRTDNGTALPEVDPSDPGTDRRAIADGLVDFLRDRADNPSFVSDNPAFDFMWIADFFDRLAMGNPFGYSARRIGDFAAGLAGDFRCHSQWKQLGTTAHSHNPVDDAVGNTEALHKLLAQAQPGKTMQP